MIDHNTSFSKHPASTFGMLTKHNFAKLIKYFRELTMIRTKRLQKIGLRESSWKKEVTPKITMILHYERLKVVENVSKYEAYNNIRNYHSFLENFNDIMCRAPMIVLLTEACMKTIASEKDEALISAEWPLNKFNHLSSPWSRKATLFELSTKLGIFFEETERSVHLIKFSMERVLEHTKRMFKIKLLEPESIDHSSYNFLLDVAISSRNRVDSILKASKEIEDVNFRTLLRHFTAPAGRRTVWFAFNGLFKDFKCV
jgi:hypothetical protein